MGYVHYGLVTKRVQIKIDRQPQIRFQYAQTEFSDGHLAN